MKCFPRRAAQGSLLVAPAMLRGCASEAPTMIDAIH